MVTQVINIKHEEISSSLCHEWRNIGLVCRCMGNLTKNLGSQDRNQSEEEVEVWSLVQPERESLEKLKRLSIRSGAWFRVINWKQRRLLDITMRTVDKVRSSLLLKVLAPLVKRLLQAVGGNVRNGTLVLMGKGAYDMMRSAAEKIVAVAQKWGNKSAKEWLDERFLRYLIVMNLPRNRNFVTIIC